jgi:Ca2+-binding RTX toxin-like protein/GH24 family phage-related lysozyme (muramidase)
MGTSISTTPLPDAVTATDELQQMLTREEGSSNIWYLDSAGIPSIGIGANLTVKANLVEAMGLLGVPTTNANIAQLQKDIHSPSALNTDVANLSTTGRTAFALRSSEVNTLFLFTSQNTISALNALLAANGTPIDNNTAQFMALASLYFNTPALVGPNLLRALKAGDNAEVWYQIRYQSDKNDSNGGIEKRRFYESQVFGLGPSTPTLAQAMQAYEVLTENRPTIIAMETKKVFQSGKNLTLGVNPNGPDPVTAVASSSVIGAANQAYSLVSGASVSPVDQAVQALAQIFNPDAEQIAAAINSQFSGVMPSVGILNDSMVGAFQVASTNILIAPDSGDISNGFAGPTQDQVEALDSPNANHILIGPDTAYFMTSQVGGSVTQAPIELIGGLGNDLLIAGAGNESLVAGRGNDTLIGGETPFATGAAGNDTLEGGVRSDVFVFDASTGAGITETIRPAIQGGSVEIMNGSSLNVLNGSSATPTLSADGNTVTWSGGSSDDGSGVSYSYDKIAGTLTITGGILGSGSGANAIEIQNFNLSAAMNGGFLGISLEKEAFLNFTANKGVDPPAPDFIAGSTQSYTFSTDGPSDTAQTVTLSLSGVDPSEFDVTVTGQTVLRNSDGSFSFTLPAGETNIAYSLTNTADVGASGTLQLTATLSDPSEPTIAAVTSNSLTQNFVESVNDPFNTPQAALYFAGSATSGTFPGFDYNYYSDTALPGAILNGTLVGGAGSGNNYISVFGAPNESVNGGPGNDTITASFGDQEADGGVDVINGNGGQDFIETTYFPSTDGPSTVRIYANSEVDLATAIADANSDSATGQQGDFIATGDSPSTIVGGNGNDLLLPGLGGGVVVAGSGDDTILGGTNVSVFVTDTNDLGGAVPFLNSTWSASFANNQLYLGGDLVYTATGNTEFNTGQGTAPPAGYEGNVDAYGTPLRTENDTIFGGRGNDVIILSNGNNEVQLGVGDTTVLGGMGNNTIIGGGGNNSIIGGGGSDYIADGSGNSLIVGRGGNNTLIGGSGNDTLFAGGGGTNWATAEMGSNYVDGGTGNAVIFGSGGDDALIAGSGNSTVFGGAGNELIDGGIGNDQLIGGSGTDTIDANGDGNDLIQTGGGNTTVYAGDGSDTIQGTSGTDVIYAGNGGTAAAPTEVLTGSGNTRVYGGDGSDIIQGTSGTDVIFAGDGGTASTPTEVIAGSGNTTVYGGVGVDEILGGAGTDVLYAGDGGTDADPTLVQAGSGTATIYGGAGAANLIDTQGGGDSIVAGSGDDNLVGTGSDTLVAGSGNDTLTGTGNVTYQFNADSGNAYVDATGGTGTLEFSSDIAPSDVSVIVDLSAGGSPELVLQDNNGTITLAGGLAGNNIQAVEFNGVGSMSLAQFVQQADAAGDTSQGTVAGINGNLIFDTSQGDSVTAGTGQDTISAWGDGDTLVAGSGGTLIYANGSDDQVIGGPGNDILDALGANTTLTGGIGNEIFDVNDPTDVVDPSGFGSDTILSSVSYTLPTLVDILTLTGSANLAATGNSDAANLITGNSGNDTLIAGSGSDTLVSGTGVDFLEGGFGGDTYVINNSADRISSILGFRDAVQSSVSYVLQAPVTSLTLTGSSDLTATDGYGFATITGNAGNDTLIGGSGADILVAGSGIDTFEAGTGSNTFVVNNSADVIEGAPENSNDEVEASCSYALVSGVDTLVLTGSANLAGTGNDDSFNFIAGNSGNDTLTAGSGSDDLQAGSGIDTLVAGSGADTLQGQSGDTYVLDAGFGNDEIQQASGTGTLQFGAGITAADLQVGVTTGSDGNPALLIQDGNSQVTIDGGLNGAINAFDFADGGQLNLTQLVSQAPAVSTTVAGASGNIIFSNVSATSIDGGIGDDTIYGYGANDTLIAGSGNQQLFGENSSDLLVGSTGADSLFGGSGDDTLVAGSGNTVLNGGSGTNSFVLTEGGTSTINASASPGTEIIYLPQGLTLSDFTSFEDSNGDLVIQSFSGDTTAIVTGFYNASSDNKTWLIAGDSDPPQFLAQWAGSQQQPISNYAQEIDQLKQSYGAELGVTLNELGEKGATIENPNGTVPSGDPSFIYQFNGVSQQSVTVTGGSLNVGPTESQQTQFTVLQQPTTRTISIPIYQTVVTPAKVAFIPVGDTPLDQLNRENNDVQTTVIGGVLGEEVFLPAETHEVVSGFTTMTVVNPGTFQVNEQEGFSVTNVTGNGGNDVITATAPYVGTVSTGDGNVSVNLGGSPSLGFFDGDIAPLGAFVEAGAGNDTIVGGSGADTIAAGTGFDYLSGALGATYYVPLEGDAVDVIADAVTPYGGGSDFPLTTLVLPTGITPQDLQYRVFQDPNTGEPVLQLRHGDSTVLVNFSNNGTFEGPTGNNASAGVNLFQFADGTVLTRDQLIAQATLLPNDFNPVVSANDQFLSLGQNVSAATFFSATDNPDNPITWYRVTNTGAGGGYFTIDGQEQSSGQTFYVRADQLSQLAYVGGSIAGIGDSVQVSAFDGAIWSAAVTFAVVPGDGTNSFEATDVDQLWVGNPNSPAVLTGGFAGDTLVGGSGQDTFIYSAGGGPEVISETAAPSSASDNILQFGSGITPGSITLSEVAGGVLRLTIGNSGDSVGIEGFDPVNPLSSMGIRQFQFSDGTDLSFSQLLAQANGSAGSFRNADGTITSYNFSPGESTLYNADTFNKAGEITEIYDLNNDGSTSVETFTYDPAGDLLTENLTNLDGSTDDSTFSYNADGSYTQTEVDTAAGASVFTKTVSNFDADGNLLSENITNPDGSTDDSTFSYNADGSYTQTEVDTAAGASVFTTTVSNFDADGNLLSENITNPDGSTDDSTFSYNADGSYMQTEVDTAAGASVFTTTVSNFDADGNLLSKDINNPNGSTDDRVFNTDGSYTETDTQPVTGGTMTTVSAFNASNQLITQFITNAGGSTDDSTFSYNSDGSHSDTVVSTAAGASVSTTEVQQYNVQGQLINQNVYTPSADGSYTDSWSKSDGSSGTYWWNSSSLEYQENWTNSNGSSFTDTYQYAAGGSPGSTGVSFTETYSDSQGDQGTRQYNASSGITSISWDSSQTGAISGMSSSDSAFVGLQANGELTNTVNDPTYFNPLVSPAFSAFLTAHG